ncbi:hypothetical protein FD428_14235 [Citrobacter sp. TBCP-5362]|nr:hypothetical protein EGX86_20335 [Citrobacter koseri]QCQ72104.1 hypothetical protein FD428_14235 [Citrobacter sp. TBCP-5362]QEU23138.1 hypothetical protein FOB54_05730 [Citrobacter koseri]
MWWTSAATTKIICVVKGSTAKKKPGGATLTGPTLQFVGRVRRSRHPAIFRAPTHSLQRHSPAAYVFPLPVTIPSTCSMPDDSRHAR